MEATIRPDAWFFGESQSRIVLSVRRKHVNRLRDLARAADVPLTVLGEIRGRRLRIGTLIDVNTADLRRSWAEALSRRMEE
jgi:phosphoribosylformylglycinamidine (FGAM) synthase-like enzyme